MKSKLMEQDNIQSVCRHCGTDIATATANNATRQQIQVPDWESSEGTPSPLGVTWLEQEQAYNFAIEAVNASNVTLMLYLDGQLVDPYLVVRFDPLPNKSGPVWHCRVPISKAGDAVYYAYQIDGPVENASGHWHAYNPEKVLLDPYAKSIFFPPDFDREAAREPNSNAGRAALGRLDVCRCPFDWGIEPRIRHGADLIIYEVHVRGFTKHSTSGLTEDVRGTFAGIIEKISYLKELGVTAIELMPVFQFDPVEGNYWGYMPLSFFAPHHGYSKNQSACEQHSQFREMVRELHAAGIEVILDVVFNHTCEGDHRGPTYSYRGIDNSSYYIASQNLESSYANFSGTGNTLDTSNPVVRRLILDSLRYWTKEMHVDGFRFDLASVFSRTSDGSVDLSRPPLFDQIASDPELANIRLIAEPWDAAGLYQLGTSFPGRTWMQWNGRFRECIQRFVRGDQGMIPDLMTRIYGSSDLFPDDIFNAFRPFQSINYIASHDGFTMYDLLSYRNKHNQANGHDNMDGPEEYSNNCGQEGDEHVPLEVMSLRMRQMKNFCCLLMLAAGTPMFRMGDEFMHTQGGNNNPYNQDNETSWLDWLRLEQNQEVFLFFKQMISFRKSHPFGGSSRFWRDQICWYGSESPNVDLSTDSQVLAYHLQHALSEEDFYVMINGSPQSNVFNIHTGSDDWKRAVDTSLPSPFDIVCCGEELSVEQPFYRVNPRSIVVLVRDSY